MLDSIFATKLDMTQVWSKQGKRLAVTRCRVDDNLVISQKSPQLFEIGYGLKKLKNMPKPLQSKLQQSGFSVGVKKIEGLRLSKPGVNTEESGATSAPQLQAGETLKVEQVLAIGDVVKVQGVTKGRGFAGSIKRHGFKGGKRTHGQSDRERATGSIGAGTDPGRVWRGKKMPGHYGVENKTISGLTVLYLNSAAGEVWLSGPVPGHYSATIKITKTGQKKLIELDQAVSGIKTSETNATEQLSSSDSIEQAKSDPVKNQSVPPKVTQAEVAQSAKKEEENQK